MENIFGEASKGFQGSGPGTTSAKEVQDLIQKVNKCSRIISRSGDGVVKLVLPRIAVIGSQSVGKSSVLESIIGKRLLPRGTDMVTRCPIEIHLIQENSLTQKTEYVFFPKDSHDAERKIENFGEVAQEIERRTDLRAKDKEVSRDIIVMEIHSPDVIDLQLVDLPGFVQVPVKGQPDDIMIQVKDLVTYFTQDSNTLILAISDGTDDMANSVAIQHAMGVDPKLERTIGVVSKLDRITGEEKITSILNVLKNKTLYLTKGYVGVINASQDEIKQKTPMEDVRKREVDFYKKNPDFQKLEPKIGVDYLKNFLHKEFYNVIQSKLPEIIQLAEKELAETREQLKTYYSNRSDVSPKSMVEKLIRDFCKKVESSLKGDCPGVSAEEIDIGAELKMFMKTEIKKACEVAMQIEKDVLLKRMINKIINLDGIRDPVTQNPKAFTEMMDVLVKQFEGPFKRFLENFTTQILEHLKNKAEESFPATPNLKMAVKNVVTKKVQELSQLCQKDVERQINVQKIYIESADQDVKYFRLLAQKQQQGQTDGGKTTYLKELRETTFMQLIEAIPNTVINKLNVPAIRGNPESFMNYCGEYLILVFGNIISVDKNLHDGTQKLILYHLIENLIEFLNDPSMLSLYKEHSVEDYRKLMESSPENQARMDILLQREQDVKEAIDVLTQV